MFKIQTIKNKQKDDIKIIDDEFNLLDNYYSIITGENGCGKSSLLSKAVNHYIFSTKDESNECRTVAGTFPKPSKVVAICNAKYNRFASKKTYINKCAYFEPYYYIQTGENSPVENPLILLIKSALQEYFRAPRMTIHETNRQPQKIEKAFEMIGLSPEVYFSLELNFDLIDKFKKAFFNNLGWEDFISDYPDELREYEYFLKNNLITRTQVAECFLMLERFDEKSKVGHGTYDFTHKECYFQTGFYFEEGLKTGIILGLVLPSKIKVRRYNASRRVSHNDLSSGQQSLLLNAIMISVFSEDRSLICIDEPENSLHPEWQLKYLKFIELLTENKSGIHFIIATHSPQIISGLSSSNSCVVSLLKQGKKNASSYSSDKNEVMMGESDIQEIHSAKEIIKQSSARQLFNIFKSPGYNNESVINRLLLILTKLTKGIKLEDDDLIFVDSIQLLIVNGHIFEFDPVIVVQNQIKAFLDIQKKKNQKNGKLVKGIKYD